MIRLLALFALSPPGPASRPPAPPPPPPGFGQMIVRQRVIVRVQQVQAGGPPARPPDAPKETRGPRCVPLLALGGAAVLAPAAVDFVLRNGLRVRARFRASCPSLDYYQGFYVAPGADGMICSGRDMIHDRSGGECQIDRFRLLVPRKP